MILLLTAAGSAACDGGRTAVKDESPAAAPAAGATASPQLLALLPAENEVPGWTLSRAPRSFTAENLWELIDGAADGFVTYGVQEVVTADYRQAGTRDEAVLEIYQMKDPLNAYGKYAEERSPEYRFLEVGNEGYSGGTSINFWAGQYYVKITTFQERDALHREMVRLAQSVAAKVPARGGAPRELSYFPGKNLLPNTTRYLPKDVLAQSYFTNGFEARYKAGEKESRLIVIVLDSAAAAREGLARYREAVAKGGEGVRELRAPGDGGFAARDSFYGNLAAVRSGKNIVVALGATTEDAGEKQLADVLRNIK
jgi:hypothetical protein